MRLKIATATALVLASLASTPAFTQQYRALRYDNTSGWDYDGRDDARDFPANGVFPGNFAADRSSAWIGAAGIFGSTPQRSATPYASQVFFGAPRDQASCGHRNRSNLSSSGIRRAKAGARRSC